MPICDALTRHPVLFASLLLTMVACQGERTSQKFATIPGQGTASGTPSSVPPGAGGGPSAGCGQQAQTGDFHLMAADGKGTMRDYEVLVPTNYDPSIPLPVVFVYHFADGTQADAKSYGIQDATGAASSAIFVYPQGIALNNQGVGWDTSCSGRDMPFFDAMLSSLEKTHCIDQDRVFVAGFSWGCQETVALACCRGDRIRAIAPASCTDEFKTPTDYKTYQSCPVTNRAAVRFTHDDSGGDSAFPAPAFETTTNLLRSFDGCASTAKPTSPSPCRAFDGCAAPVVDCGYPKLDHALPGGWGADTWAFFASLK